MQQNIKDLSILEIRNQKKELREHFKQLVKSESISLDDILFQIEQFELEERSRPLEEQFPILRDDMAEITKDMAEITKNVNDLTKSSKLLMSNTQNRQNKFEYVVNREFYDNLQKESNDIFKIPLNDGKLFHSNGNCLVQWDGIFSSFNNINEDGKLILHLIEVKESPHENDIIAERDNISRKKSLEDKIRSTVEYLNEIRNAQYSKLKLKQTFKNQCILMQQYCDSDIYIYYAGRYLRPEIKEALSTLGQKLAKQTTNENTSLTNCNSFLDELNIDSIKVSKKIKVFAIEVLGVLSFTDCSSSM